MYISSSFNKAFAISDCTTSNDGMTMNTELEIMWRETPCPNSRYYLTICLDGLRKNTKNLGQNIRCPERD
jgi:hypothetical protein